MSRRLPPVPEERRAPWKPPSARKSTPPPAVPEEIRKDQRQLDLWTASLKDEVAAEQATLPSEHGRRPA